MKQLRRHLGTMARLERDAQCCGHERHSWRSDIRPLAGYLIENSQADSTCPPLGPLMARAPSTPAFDRRTPPVGTGKHRRALSVRLKVPITPRVPNQDRCNAVRRQGYPERDGSLIQVWQFNRELVTEYTDPTTGVSFTVPGVVMSVRKNVMRTEGLMVEAVLGVAPSLDAYNGALQDEALRERQVANEAALLSNRREQLVQQVVGSGSASQVEALARAPARERILAVGDFIVTLLEPGARSFGTPRPALSRSAPIKVVRVRRVRAGYPPLPHRDARPPSRCHSPWYSAPVTWLPHSVSPSVTDRCVMNRSGAAPCHATRRRG